MRSPSGSAPRCAPTVPGGATSPSASRATSTASAQVESSTGRLPDRRVTVSKGSLVHRRRTAAPSPPGARSNRSRVPHAVPSPRRSPCSSPPPECSRSLPARSRLRASRCSPARRRPIARRSAGHSTSDRAVDESDCSVDLETQEPGEVAEQAARGDRRHPRDTGRDGRHQRRPGARRVRLAGHDQRSAVDPRTGDREVLPLHDAAAAAAQRRRPAGGPGADRRRCAGARLVDASGSPTPATRASALSRGRRPPRAAAWRSSPTPPVPVPCRGANRCRAGRAA